jgi:hypothetical protein
MKLLCANRESNSGHLVGNEILCHLTIRASRLFFLPLSSFFFDVFFWMIRFVCEIGAAADIV